MTHPLSTPYQSAAKEAHAEDKVAEVRRTVTLGLEGSLVVMCVVGRCLSQHNSFHPDFHGVFQPNEDVEHGLG